MISVGNSDIQAENVPFWKQVIDSATPLMDINGYLFKQQQQRHKRHHHQHKEDDGEAAPAAQAAPAAPAPHHVYVPLVETLEFRSLCILRCLRPDKVVDSVQTFIKTAMGNHFVDPPAFDVTSR
jgi:hypothetical protein